ncbi:hypothetical protein AB0M45_28840 [Nocardia sp. NPDC051787]|uniref:hypothetical protein n=1 Tax=Nocardia sp. NPDC051787 TaxID=3155415 RepID=UPI0034244C23
MKQFGSLTHLGLYLIDKETGGPITRHPIYAEVVVTQYDPGSAGGRIDEAASAGDLEALPASDRSVEWSAPLGVLWTDHVGYVSYDLTRLPSPVCHQLDSEAVLRRAGVVRRNGGGGEEAISIRALPYGCSAWIDVLDQGRFTVGAVVGRLVVPRPGPRPPHYGTGMSSMQNPSLTDWQLSPSSFATDPNQLIGEIGCENRYPATLSLHQFVTRQVVRLSDDPQGIDIPDPYRAAYIDEYKVTWSALGHSLGEILYSIPLAPGESVKLGVIDWSGAGEDMLHQTHRDRTISETVQAGLREMQYGATFMGGVAHSGGGSGGAKLGLAGLGAAVGDAWSVGGCTATSAGSRELIVQNVQRLSDSFCQASYAQRELNSTVVIQVGQEEKESIHTRTFVNYNRAHTLTILYYEVLRHYRVTVQFLRRRAAVLVKYPAAITTFGMAELLRHRAALEPVLVDPTLAPGFAALVKQDQAARNQTLHNVDPAKLDKPIPQFWEGDIRFALFEFGVYTSEGLRDKTDELAVVKLIVLEGNSTVTRPLLEHWEKGSETRNGNVGERLDDTAMCWFIAKPSSGPVAWRDLVGFEFVLHDDDEWRMDRLAIRAFHPGGAVSLLDDTDVDFYFPLNGASNTVTFIRRPGPRPADLRPTWSPAKSLTPEEYQAAQRLIDHVNTDNAYYNRAIMLATRTADISVAFESLPWQGGKTLADVAMPTPLEVFGNHVAYPLTAAGAVIGDPPPEAQAERLITMPTRGVFAEAELGHCNTAAPDREVRAEYGGPATGGSGAGAGEPPVELGSGRTTPSDRSSTTNRSRAPGTTVPITAANDTQLGQAAAVEFFDATDVDNYFLDTTGKTFAGWFSATLAGRGSWGPLSMSMDIDTLNRFTETWNAFPAIVGTDRGAGVPGIALPEFATLMAKFLHETGGRLLFRGAETVGGYGHPGLSYAFDSFVIHRPGENPFTKGSHNTSNGNRTAFACFHDPIYLAVFGTLAPTAQAVRDRTEWKGTVWPTGVPTTIDSSTAFLQGADFYKFRGRGAIQSTGRVAYLPIVDFVRGYTGDDSRITAVKQRWADLATTLASQGITLTTNDDFATASSNADWDGLFRSITIQAVAVRGHNHIPGKHYLPMSSSVAVLRGTGRGSAYFVAIGTAGNNPSYGNDVRQRMLEFMGTLWRTPMPAPGPGDGTIEL